MPLSKSLVKSGFSRAAENYEQFATLQRYIAEELVKFGWPYLDHNGLIVDVGSGTGFIKQILKQANIIQIDISESMCQQCINLAPAVVGDMEQMPVKNNSVDGIISSLTLQWVTDIDTALEEIFRVLKPGGTFVLSTFGSHTLQELKSAFRIVDQFSHVNRFIFKDDLEEQAKTKGFNDVYMREELKVLEYNDVMQLMHTMKKIGASNKQTLRKKSLSSRKYFRKLDDAYRRTFSRSTYIPATWEMLYIKGTKPL